MFVTSRFFRLVCGAATLSGIAAFATPAAAQSPSHVYLREGTRISAFRGPAPEQTVATKKSETRTLSGLVTDAVNNAPIASVRVYLDGVATNVTTNRDGKFYLRNVSPGTHTIELRAIGYTPRSKDIRVTFGPATAIELWMNRAIVAEQTAE